MRVSGDWLDRAGTQAILACLSASGWQALVVGGCVRNSLLGFPVSDVDIATDALPETVTSLATAAGFRVVPTGVKHGTVTIIADSQPYEVTTFRRDLETDGRRAAVAFSDRLEVDAARRDFTMNALYARFDGTVVDPLGGMADLKARKVRFVGDAKTRIREDYLRILRFFRFHAWYGDPLAGLDAEGIAACAALADGLSRLSKERIGAEMKRLLAAPDPAPSVASMAAAGVLGRILPGADHRALAPLVHLEEGHPPRWTRRLAALGGDFGSLRLSRAEAREVAALAKTARDARSAAELGWLLGAELGHDAALLRAALTDSQLPPGTAGDVARGAAAVFPIAAADLPGLSGPALGRRLKDLQERWLASGLRATRDQLLA